MFARDEEEARNALSRSKSDLFLDLGYSIGPSKTAVPRSLEEVRDIGESWLKARQGQIRSAICTAKIHKLLQEKSDEVQLVVVVADLIAASISLIPPFTVAALVVKLGLREFCASFTGDPEQLLDSDRNSGDDD